MLDIIDINLPVSSINAKIPSTFDSKIYNKIIALFTYYEEVILTAQR